MGMISRRRPILSYTIQQVIPNICIKFQNPRFISSWEIFDEKKKFTHKPTNIVTEKTKTIYPYTLRITGRGYNKGNNMQEEADSLSHNTKRHTQYLYQIQKF